MTHIRGALLDIDGTLLDSNDAHARAWVDVLTEHGIDVTFERLRRLIGKGGDKVLAEVAGIDDESEEGKRLSARRRVLFATSYLPALRPLPGARALVERLKHAGIEPVIATSASEEELGGLLERAGVRDLIQTTTSSDDAERSKPDPDIVHAAVKRAGHPPDALLMVGDTPYDVEAARRAGVQAIALRSGGWGDPDLAGAVAIYDDAADLVARFDTSPFGR